MPSSAVKSNVIGCLASKCETMHQTDKMFVDMATNFPPHEGGQSGGHRVSSSCTEHPSLNQALSNK